jgi:integrase
MSTKRSSKPRRRPPLPKAATWPEVERQLKALYLRLRDLSPLAALAAVDASVVLLREQIKLHQEISTIVLRDRRRHKL